MPRLITFGFMVAVSVTACGKKDESAGSGGGKTASGLPWTPDGYDKLGPTCKKALACCEAVVKGDKPGATADDYNLKCSGPATWSEDDCKTDLDARMQVFEGEQKPAPAECK